MRKAFFCATPDKPREKCATAQQAFDSYTGKVSISFKLGSQNVQPASETSKGRPGELLLLHLSYPKFDGDLNTICYAVVT